MKTWPLSAILLILAGIGCAGIGFYFLALRPALLPEDLRFLGVDETTIAQALPQLATWLKSVFRVLGGYALATGILTITIAATSIRRRSTAAIIGAALAGASSIGLMAVLNFGLDSDFKWPLAAGALLWAAGIVAFLIERRGAASRADM